MTRAHHIINLLPATSGEIAAQFGISVRLANAHLQYLRRTGRARHTGSTLAPRDARTGPREKLWECQ